MSWFGLMQSKELKFFLWLMTSHVFDLPTYLVLLYNVPLWGLSWTPLPTLISDVINGRSLTFIYLPQYTKFLSQNHRSILNKPISSSNSQKNILHAPFFYTNAPTFLWRNKLFSNFGNHFLLAKKTSEANFLVLIWSKKRTIIFWILP